MDFIDLLEIARQNINEMQFSPRAKAGWVSSALLAENGKIYTGINLDVTCELGCCAEYSAIVGMVNDGESVIQKIVTVKWDGEVRPPCGKCRELISILNTENVNTEILVTENTVKRISELLPYDWKYIDN